MALAEGRGAARRILTQRRCRSGSRAAPAGHAGRAPARSVSPYLVEERGLAPGTVTVDLHIARLFLATRPAEDLGLDALSPAEIVAFVKTQCEKRSAPYVTTGLRAFLRFCHVTGRTQAAARRRGPQGRLLATGGAAEGARPRDGEGAAVELRPADDLWQAGLRGAHAAGPPGPSFRRGRRPCASTTSTGAPGSSSSGARARSSSDSRCRPTSARRSPLGCAGAGPAATPARSSPASGPRTERLSPSGIYAIVRGRVRARGVLEHVHPHQLRHTAATEMLRAGAGLAEIGQVLRHQSACSRPPSTRRSTETACASSRLPWPAGTTDGEVMTALEKQLGDYLALRRSMGFKLERAEKLLRQFVGYCDSVDARGHHDRRRAEVGHASRGREPELGLLSGCRVVRGFSRHLALDRRAHRGGPDDLVPASSRAGRPPSSTPKTRSGP